MTYARISVTVPKTVLAAADRRARELGRSRSWVVAEALAAYVAQPTEREPARRVREATATYQMSPGLGEQRQAQLESDLALTPEQRVIEAERTARATPAPATRWTGVLTFDRFEDYLRWKRREAIGR
jgi:hypothetical protein